MVLREGALTFEGSHHGDLKELRQLKQLVSGLGVQDALAGVDHRPMRRHQRTDAAGDGRGISRDAHLHRRDVVKVLLADLIGHQIGGDFQKDGPGLAGAQLGISLPEKFGNPVGKVDVAGPLGDSRVGLDGMEVRFHAQAIARDSSREHEDGHGVGVGLGDAAEGIFGAGAILGKEDADLVAVGDPGKAVSHVHTGAFLATHDGSDAGDGRRLDQRVGRHDGDPVNSLHLQYISYCGDSVHGGIPPLLGMKWMRWVAGLPFS